MSVKIFQPRLHLKQNLMIPVKDVAAFRMIMALPTSGKTTAEVVSKLDRPHTEYWSGKHRWTL